MKFDIVVGNPPYQDSSNVAKNNKLWHRFVKRILGNISKDYVLLVTPSSIFNDSVGIGKWFREQTDLIKLVDYSIHTKNQWFNVGVDTCHWVLTKKSDTEPVKFPSIRNPIADSIAQKMLNSSKFLQLVFENDHITKSDTGSGKTEVYYSGTNLTTTDSEVFNGGLKIVYPFSASYSSQFITDKPTCRFNKVRYITNEQEGINILSFTNSKLFRFYAATYLKTAGFTPVVKNANLLPELDSSRSWNDEEVYEHFHLSEEEITEVEKFFSKKSLR